MVENPILLQQAAVVTLGGAGVLFMTQQLLAAFGIGGDPTTALRLDRVGGVVCVAGLTVAVLFGLYSLIVGSAAGVAFTVLATALCLFAAGLGFFGRTQHRAASIRMLGRVDDLAPYDRLRVLRGYAARFPNAVEPMQRLMEDMAGLRLLKQLHDEGIRFDRRPIPDAVGEWCRRAPPGVIRRALEVGLFDDDEELLRAMQRELHQAYELEWEAVLTRAPDALIVGQAVRAILEEALARQSRRVTVRVTGHRLEDRSARLAINALVTQLREHLARVNLELVTEYGDREQSNQRSTTNNTIPLSPVPGRQNHVASVADMTIEVLRQDTQQLSYQDTASEEQSVRPHIQGPGARNSKAFRSVRSHRLVTRTTNFPIVRVRFSLQRDKRTLASCEADSTIGLEQLEGNVAKMGIGPSNVAANTLFTTIVQATGMTIRRPRGPRRLPEPCKDVNDTNARLLDDQKPEALTVPVQEHSGG